MRPVHYSLTPENGFYKQTVAEWEKALGILAVDGSGLNPFDKVTRSEFIRRAHG